MTANDPYRALCPTCFLGFDKPADLICATPDLHVPPRAGISGDAAAFGRRPPATDRPVSDGAP